MTSIAFETTSSPVLDAFKALVRQVHAWRVRRAQRVAIAVMLEMEPYRLDDMGLGTADLCQAINSRWPSRVLNARRAERARAWTSEAAFVA